MAGFAVAVQSAMGRTGCKCSSCSRLCVVAVDRMGSMFEIGEASSWEEAYAGRAAMEAKRGLVPDGMRIAVRWLHARAQVG
jgi:hypothetical protein